MLRRFAYHRLIAFTKVTPLQSTEDATRFYEAKVEELSANLKDLETIIQGKSNNLRVVEDGKSHFDVQEGEFC